MPSCSVDQGSTSIPAYTRMNPKGYTNPSLWRTHAAGIPFQARQSRRYEYLGRRDGRDLNPCIQSWFWFIMEPSRAAPVIIIGAGLVGPILAQALSARSIPYLIYEQDPHASHRGVGWGLTIHWALEIFKYLVPASIIQGLPRRVCRSRGSEIRRERKFLVL
jgi:hypothetical protein